MKANTGQEPAFPAMDMNSHMGVDRMELRYVGLTKREYFAAMAMQAILSNPSNNNLDLMGVNTAGPLGFIACNLAAKEAVQYADELLKALEL